MKLALVALAGSATAFNITQYALDTWDQVYKPKANGAGFDIQADPFLSMSCHHTTKNEGDVVKINCNGKNGNGGAQNVFTRKIFFNKKSGVLKTHTMDKGNTNNIWGMQFWHADWQNLNFKLEDSIVAKWKNYRKATLEWNRKGNVGKYKNLHTNLKLQVKEAGIVGGRYSGVTKITGHIKMPRNFPATLNPMNIQPVKFNLEAAVKAAKQCLKASFAPGCDLQAGISGQVSKREVDYSVSYAVSAADVGSDYLMKLQRDARVDSILVKVTPNFGSVTYQKLEPEEPSVLWIQFPLVDQWPIIQESAMDLIEPFSDYANKSMTDLTTAATAVVWIDQRFAKLDREFDCSRLAADTLIESEWIAKKISKNHAGWPTLQAGFATNCAAGNDYVVGFLKGPASQFISYWRGWANRLTNENVGKAKYDTWFAENFPLRVALLPTDEESP